MSTPARADGKCDVGGRVTDLEVIEAANTALRTLNPLPKDDDERRFAGWERADELINHANRTPGFLAEVRAILEARGAKP